VGLVRLTNRRLTGAHDIKSLCLLRSRLPHAPDRATQRLVAWGHEWQELRADGVHATSTVYGLEAADSKPLDPPFAVELHVEDTDGADREVGS